MGRGSPEQVLDGWKYFGYDYSEEEIKEVTRERTLEFLELLEGKPFAEPNPQPMFPQGSGKLRIEPYSEESYPKYFQPSRTCSGEPRPTPSCTLPCVMISVNPAFSAI